MLIRTYKYPLRPTAAQRAGFERWLGQSCELYNAALEQRITGYRRTGKSVTYNDQTRQLTELRNAEPEFGALPVRVQRSALRRLDKAFQAFFGRVKSKASKAGFPRFRARARYDTFGIGRVGPRLDQADSSTGHLRVAALGLVRFRMRHEMIGDVRDVTITKDSRGRWFVCFACDVGEAPPKRTVTTAVGIDLGLSSFATLTDGSEIANPRHTRTAAESLARAQRVLSRKSRGSRSRAKAKAAVARVHERIRNARRDFHYKTARALVERYDLIAHEDLSIARNIESIHNHSAFAQVTWSREHGFVGTRP
jgi:putative transposase